MMKLLHYKFKEEKEGEKKSRILNACNYTHFRQVKAEEKNSRKTTGHFVMINTAVMLCWGPVSATLDRSCS